MRAFIGGLVVLAAAMPATAAAQATNERLAEATRIEGIVFEDRNGDGRWEAGEPGLSGIAVSDQVQVVITDESGRFVMDAHGYGLVFMSQPDGYVVNGSYWRVADGAPIEFGLTSMPSVSSFTFVHASDTHLSEASIPRMRRLREMVDSLRPAFVVITGDLVRDALRVPEEVARGYYELLADELAKFTVPVFTVPGNHEKFGIERHQSLVSSTHPLYGNRMYRHYRGPNYFSFTYGGVHFLGLDTVDYDDLWYYGHVDDLQLGWITAAAVVGPPSGSRGAYGPVSGITLHRVTDGHVDDGTFLPLDPVPGGR